MHKLANDERRSLAIVHQVAQKSAVQRRPQFLAQTFCTQPLLLIWMDFMKKSDWLKYISLSATPRVVDLATI